MIKLFVLLTVLALGHGEVDTTLEIAVDFNPCDWKMCGADEDCRVIDHSELLEIPVAACVKKNVRPTEAGNCKSLSIGTNILNCKTALEWTAIGQAQCIEEELEIGKGSLKTKYVCHQKEDEQYKYLSVEFSCCQRETPSVLTVATPDTTTMPSDRPREDGWGAEGHQATSSNSFPTDLVKTDDDHDDDDHHDNDHHDDDHDDDDHHDDDHDNDDHHDDDHHDNDHDDDDHHDDDHHDDDHDDHDDDDHHDDDHHDDDHHDDDHHDNDHDDDDHHDDDHHDDDHHDDDHHDDDHDDDDHDDDDHHDDDHDDDDHHDDDHHDNDHDDDDHHDDDHDDDDHHDDDHHDDDHHDDDHHDDDHHDDDYLEGDEDDEGNNEPVIVFLIVFALLACVVVLVGLAAYARYIAKKCFGGYKGLPTVLINAHCDDHKVVYEIPNYPEKRQPQSIHKNFYY